MLSILFFTKFFSKKIGNFMEGFVVNFLSNYKTIQLIQFTKIRLSVLSESSLIKYIRDPISLA